MPISLLDQLHRIPIAFVDVETTGASAVYGDRVIEIGIARVEGGRVVEEYQQLFDPQRRIGAGVVALTGITQDMVTGQPTFETMLPEVTRLLQGAVVAGHNVRFDLSFLAREFRIAHSEIGQVLGPAQVLDTVRIARRRFGRGGNGLGRLACRLGVPPVVAHRALADAMTTYHVFDRMIEPAGGWNLCLCDAIVQQGGPMGLHPISSRESELPLEIQEALDQRTTVVLEYLDAGQNRTHRAVKPVSVRRFKGELILIAHCELRNDRRNFKLDRIVSVTRPQVDDCPAAPTLFSDDVASGISTTLPATEIGPIAKAPPTPLCNSDN